MMNKRLKELMIEAENQSWDTYTIAECRRHKSYEKFAELIIKECERVVLVSALQKQNQSETEEFKDEKSFYYTKGYIKGLVAGADAIKSALNQLLVSD